MKNTRFFARHAVPRGHWPRVRTLDCHAVVVFARLGADGSPVILRGTLLRAAIGRASGRWTAMRLLFLQG